MSRPTSRSYQSRLLAKQAYAPAAASSSRSRAASKPRSSQPSAASTRPSSARRPSPSARSQASASAVSYHDHDDEDEDDVAEEEEWGRRESALSSSGGSSSGRSRSRSRSRPRDAASPASSSSSAAPVIRTTEEQYSWLNRLAERCQADGRYAELLTVRVQALALARLCFGNNDVETGLARSRLAEAYLYSGLGAQASEHALVALSVGQRAGTLDLQTHAHNVLGLAYKLQKDSDKALHHLHAALRLNSELHSQAALSNAPLMANIAKVQFERSNFAQAVDIWQRVWQLLEAVHGAESVELLDCYLEMGRAMCQLQQWGEASQQLQRVVDIGARFMPSALQNRQARADNDANGRSDGKSDHRTDDALTSDVEEKYDDSRPSRQQASDSQANDESKSGQDAIDPNASSTIRIQVQVAEASALLADCAKHADPVDSEAALRHYHRALELAEYLDPEGPLSAQALKLRREMATLAVQLERYSEAADHQRGVLAAQQHQHEYYSAPVAKTLQRIGDISMLTGDFREAVESYRQALEIFDRLNGGNGKGSSSSASPGSPSSVASGVSGKSSGSRTSRRNSNAAENPTIATIKQRLATALKQLKALKARQNQDPFAPASSSQQVDESDIAQSQIQSQHVSEAPMDDVHRPSPSAPRGSAVLNGSASKSSSSANDRYSAARASQSPTSASSPTRDAPAHDTIEERKHSANDSATAAASSASVSFEADASLHPAALINSVIFMAHSRSSSSHDFVLLGCDDTGSITATAADSQQPSLTAEHCWKVENASDGLMFFRSLSSHRLLSARPNGSLGTAPRGDLYEQWQPLDNGKGGYVLRSYAESTSIAADSVGDGFKAVLTSSDNCEWRLIAAPASAHSSQPQAPAAVAAAASPAAQTEPARETDRERRLREARAALEAELRAEQQQTRQDSSEEHAFSVQTVQD